MIRERTTRRPAARYRLAALVAAVLLLAACTNSKWLIGAFYDRADDKAMEAADEWIGFDPAQRDAFAAYVGTFHTWHRREELPRYAALMRDMTDGLSTWDQATPSDFQGWFDRIEERVEAVRACHPARYATPLARTLTDAQVARVERTWRDKRAENVKRSADRSRSDRIERRVDNIATWAGRLGVELDDDQIELLRDTFTQQISLQREYRTLSDDWNETLFALGDTRAEPDFDAALDAHIDNWFGMLGKAYPNEVQANRELWRDFAIRFEKTLSRRQRRDALRWIDKLADTLDAIARDTPDWLPADDPAYGCVVDSGGGAAGNEQSDEARS